MLVLNFKLKPNLSLNAAHGRIVLFPFIFFLVQATVTAKTTMFPHAILLIK